MAAVSYSLCVLTAFACAILLTRAYRTSRSRLLFWGALCFWGLTLTNAIAFVDVLVVPEHDLYAEPTGDRVGVRIGPALRHGLGVALRC